jgi:hypothetical protein
VRHNVDVEEGHSSPSAVAPTRASGA